MIALILFPVILIALLIVGHYLSEATFMIEAILMFFSRLPDLMSWLPGPVLLFIPVMFAVIFALRIWGKL